MLVDIFVLGRFLSHLAPTQQAMTMTSCVRNIPCTLSCIQYHLCLLPNPEAGPAHSFRFVALRCR